MVIAIGAPAAQQLAGIELLGCLYIRGREHGRGRSIEVGAQSIAAAGCIAHGRMVANLTATERPRRPIEVAEGRTSAGQPSRRRPRPRLAAVARSSRDRRR